MMRKKLLACVMAAVLALSLTACEKSNRTDVWENRQIYLDDVAYSLPMNFSTLVESLDWKVDTNSYDSDSYLESGETKEICQLYKDDYAENVALYVRVTNYGKDRAKLVDCQVSRLGVRHTRERDKEAYDKIPKVVLANDITWGSTGDEVEKVLGKPKYNNYLDEPMVCDMYTYEFPDEDGCTDLSLLIGYGVFEIMISRVQK